MAYVKINSDAQKRHEAQVLRSFGVNPQRATKEQREYAQEISRRTAEYERSMKK